ncbi:hypothetical protein B296_00056864 [Ensete ventricosum]|uniref:Aminotransferase class I/classII large domain-containing protein n=1 Tax=Ensete ventricosum TaxID=4639 RepID=A0A426X2N4_ENSVE|nr:hypothetical protein B296_00056864 [Ensete ventricosum]
MPNTRCRLSSTISPGIYHCRNVTLTGCEGVGREQFIPRNQTSRSPTDVTTESGLLQLMETSNVEPWQEERGLPRIRTPIDANGASDCSSKSVIGAGDRGCQGSQEERPAAVDVISNGKIGSGDSEIYSGLVFSSDEFVSMAEIVEACGHEEHERVHIVCSLSKDPGYKVGTIYSYNNEVVMTMRRMSSFTLVSSQTQKMLASKLSNKEFMENYLRTNRERLKKRHEFVVEGLSNIGSMCLQGNAGLFC